MYICNLKLDVKKIIIIIAIFLVAISLIIEIRNSSSLSLKNYDYVLDETNFTNILKSVHDNIDENIGKTIKLSGFIFKLPDFKEGYFVCGRNMMLNGEEKVVGFLCFYDGNISIKDSEWFEITGEFIKGYYTTDMPVIKVHTIDKIIAPSNTFVETPNFL